MDQKYKGCKYWSKHGDIRPDKTADVQTSENEAYELMRTAFIASDGKTPFEKQNS